MYFFRKHGDHLKSQATGILGKEKPFSDDFNRIWSTYRGKHLSSPPPFHWESIDSQSSMFPPSNPNISDYFDNLSSSSNPDVSMPLRLHDAFDRNHGDVSREFKASSYGEPSSFSGWVQSLGEDFEDKFRKVRFAEPPESNVIDLDSKSSCAPSVDWDFREPFGPFTAKFSIRNIRNANQNVDESANNTIDSLAGEMDKIDLQKYFTDNTVGGFELKGNSVPFPSSQWQTSYYSSSPSSYDTFPRSSQSGTSSRITIPIKYVNAEFYALTNIIYHYFLINVSYKIYSLLATLFVIHLCSATYLAKLDSKYDTLHLLPLSKYTEVYNPIY